MGNKFSFMHILLNSRCNLELLNFLFAVSYFLKILFVSQNWKFKTTFEFHSTIYFSFSLSMVKS